MLQEECLRLTGESKNLNSHQIYALHQDKFVGGITIERFDQGDTLWIGSFAIMPAYRRQGIGTKLLAQVYQFAKMNHIFHLQLNTYFEEAHQFWLAQDFETVAILPNWKYGLTCYCMHKSLVKNDSVVQSK